MPCDDVLARWPRRRLVWVMAAAGLVGLSGCAGLPWQGQPPEPAPAPPASSKRLPDAPAPAAVEAGPVKLSAPATPRDWTHARRQAAERLVAANPHLAYGDRTPDVLLAIPVMSIELNADGSVRRIEVMRYPKQARDTVQLAFQAIRNAAPFGNVSRLPKPWRFNETFLFNDHRKFKPMTLDRR